MKDTKNIKDMRKLVKPEQIEIKNGVIALQLNDDNIDNQEIYKYLVSIVIEGSDNIFSGFNNLRDWLNYETRIYGNNKCVDCEKNTMTYLVICSCRHTVFLLCEKCKDRTLNEGVAHWCSY